MTDVEKIHKYLKESAERHVKASTSFEKATVEESVKDVPLLILMCQQLTHALEYYLKDDTEAARQGLKIKFLNKQPKV